MCIFIIPKTGKKDLLDILKENGCNTIRLRSWHTPVNEHFALPQVIIFAKRIKEKRFKLWLAIYYPDASADPGKQAIPALWDSLPLNILEDSVDNYIKNVVLVLQPHIVQVGNEINNGFFWPDGNISNA